MPSLLWAVISKTIYLWTPYCDIVVILIPKLKQTLILKVFFSSCNILHKLAIFYIIPNSLKLNDYCHKLQENYY